MVIIICIILALILYRHYRLNQIKKAIKLTGQFSIDSCEPITLNGIQQWIWIRSVNVNHPILLFIHGGPGKAEMGLMHPYQRQLEQHMTVIHWDQRGAGKSFQHGLSQKHLTMKHVIDDMIALTKILLDRFQQKKIFLLGHSWGSVLAMHAALKHPEFFHAYFGMGQVTNHTLSHQLAHKHIIKLSQQQNDNGTLKKLRKIGLPPYQGNLRKVAILFSSILKYGGELAHKNGYGRLWFNPFLFPHYSLWDVLYRYPMGMNFSLKCLIQRVENTNLFDEIQTLAIPCYFFLGRHDFNTSSTLAEKYLLQLQAPQKKIFWFEQSAHSPIMEEPERFQDTLIQLIQSFSKSVASSTLSFN